MSESLGLAGDQARASVLVKVEPKEAFRIFTEEIDSWWRRGGKYRVAGSRPGIIAIEPGVGGRLFESFEEDGDIRVIETGRVTGWEPPSRLVFEWRALAFGPEEKTKVEVTFEPRPGGTSVTVTHSGWSRIRLDHSVRHGLEVAPFLRMLGLWWGELMTSLREEASNVVREGKK